jgi:putative transposase
MLRIIKCLVGMLFAASRSRADMALEILSLKDRGPRRPRLTRWDRILWVFLSKVCPVWSQLLVIVKPETVVRWHRHAFRAFWRWKSLRGKPGRPRIDAELRNLIRQMAAENLWRAPRIHKELIRLGFEVSERTVARVMPKLAPSPAARQSWQMFLRNHRHAIAAMDLFVVPTITFRLVYGFFVIHHDRRRILHANVTEHPTASWVSQQLREAFPWEAAASYLVCDNDTIFSAEVRGAIDSMGMKIKRTAFRSPWQNSVAERWIGCLRQALLHHVIVFSEEHLRRLVRDYVVYHNADRLHCALDGDAPHVRPIERRPSPTAKVIAVPRLGGLHHRYRWQEAA